MNVHPPPAAVARFAPLLILLLACVGPGTPTPRLPEVIGTGNEGRIEALDVGLSREQVRERVGVEPIANPVEPGASFANPYLEFPFRAPDGRRVEVWLYVVELQTAAECPELSVRDRPVVFEQGRLVARDWAGLEQRLEAYGRSADWYRKLRHPGPGRCDRRR